MGTSAEVDYKKQCRQPLREEREKMPKVALGNDSRRKETDNTILAYKKLWIYTGHSKSSNYNGHQFLISWQSLGDSKRGCATTQGFPQVLGTTGPNMQLEAQDNWTLCNHETELLGSFTHWKHQRAGIPG